MILLRPITAADISAIKNWPPYEPDFAQMDYALREQGWLDDFYNMPGAHLYAVEDNVVVIGFTLLNITKDAEAEFRIALHPHHVGKGIGQEVTQETLRIGFGQLGLERITLIVRKNNPRAARLYERVGFSKNGESVHAVQRKPIEFIDMVITREQFSKTEAE